MDIMHTRWTQLLLGLLCMVVISSPQYVWTLFTQPLKGRETVEGMWARQLTVDNPRAAR